MKRVLILNQKEFSYDQISAGEFDRNLLTEFERNTLLFCRDWLNGKGSFELQTSGSTGIPKKIKVLREQMKASAWLTINRLGLTSEDTALVCISTAYIGGKMMLVRGLEAGLNLVAVEPASDPFEKIDESAFVNFTALVPLQLKKALGGGQKHRRLLDEMKAIIVGGGAISSELELQTQAIKSPVYSTYGMTETVSHIAVKKVNEPGKDKYFKVFEGIDIDQDDRGCLTIKGAVTNGETIVTNDVVDIIDDHAFLWIGRADNIINSGGIKINAEQLEQKIDQLADGLLKNKRFFIAGLKDEALGEQVTFILESVPMSIILEATLLEKLKAGLPPYHHPRRVLYLPRFVETETGKINRNACLALFDENSKSF